MSATRSSVVAVAGSTLIATKLNAPQPRAGLVVRRELVGRLIDGDSRKLTLVCAPAGWGKTVLLSEWNASAEERRPFAWVSLDPTDDDPARFWSYVIAALRTVDSELGAEAAVALPDAGSALVDVVLPPLLNDLASLSRPLVLVLDDYHSVHNELIHASVAFLLRHLPPTLQLALATRADPPLPLAAMRAGGDVIEIRAAELRFSASEADELLNGSLRLSLDQADIELLQTRTEGWAAGLQLAALSARSHEDKHAFIRAFAGDDRQIGEYLHELLADQSSLLRDFLLQTSILERFSAPLCDAVTGRADSGACLEQAERSNLFLVPLDSQRRWYRYHHLFRDLLRLELGRTRPGLLSELHRRAATWFGDEGLGDEAISHATAAGDVDQACELIRNHLVEMFVLGQYETVARWIDALPRSLVRADAGLCARRAWCALHLGRLDDAASWRREFEHVDWSASRGVDDPTSPDFPLAAFDAGYASRRGDVGQALRAARVVANAFRDESDPRSAYAEMNLGEVLFYAGRIADAAACLEGAVRRLASAEPSAFVSQALLHGHVYLATIRADLGRLDEAERSIADAERLIRNARQSDHHPNAAFLHVSRGKLLDLRGDSAAAEASLVRAEEFHRRKGWPLDHAYALLLLAGVKRRLRKHTEARTVAREARQVLAACPDPGMLRELLLRTERSLQLTAPASAPVSPIALELSERELDVLRLLASELSQREIGSELYVSFNTVKSHTRAIFRKLGVSTRADAVARARELDLI